MTFVVVVVHMSWSCLIMGKGRGEKKLKSIRDRIGRRRRRRRRGKKWVSGSLLKRWPMANCRDNIFLSSLPTTLSSSSSSSSSSQVLIVSSSFMNSYSSFYLYIMEFCMHTSHTDTHRPHITSAFTPMVLDLGVDYYYYYSYPMVVCRS